MRKRCVCIGAGEYDFLYVHDQNDYVIAVDGGYDYLKEQNLRPDLLVGDFDSTNLNISEDNSTIERIQLPVHKDDTDMLAALKIAIDRGYQDFVIYGATGKRLDHTLANIQCLLYLKKHNASGRLVDSAQELMVLHKESYKFSESMSGIMSLFSLESKAIVSLDGFMYELKQAEVTNDYPLGISNEFIGKEATITIYEGFALVITSSN